jgi:nitrite reductase/ring-hydroxylating ferredoxin subunit
MSDPVQVNRRDFLTTVAAASAVAAFSLPVLQASAREKPKPPTTPIDVGTLADYGKDGVTDTWAKKAGSFFVVRKDGKLFAVSSICTHRFCPVAVKDDELFCNCHKSHFSLDGEALSGPATNTGSLPHYAISVNDKGKIMVDAQKEFSEAKWTDAASFIKV